MEIESWKRQKQIFEDFYLSIFLAKEIKQDNYIKSLHCGAAKHRQTQKTDLKYLDNNWKQTFYGFLRIEWIIVIFSLGKKKPQQIFFPSRPLTEQWTLGTFFNLSLCV